ncbi:MAG: hypothetical protein BWY42_01270 [Candidatus Omnitrophica bacterium ADurb.Bin277]|nr:MAG: hypothetical protein BWY42_01270 [Candidatus Omnitrophica bacterium ADurb.Bin277]
MEWLNNAVVQAVINALIPVALPFLVGGIGWLLIKGIELLGKYVKTSQTKIDDYLLGVAVKFAEDKIGPKKGDIKLMEACQWLEKATGGRIKADVAEPFVRAKYQEIFGELSKLKNA